MIHQELSETIIGASIKMLNALKPGLNEKAYENALAIELRKRDHDVDQQRRFNVLYEGQLVDTLVPDMIVNGLVIADPESHGRFHVNSYCSNDRLSYSHQPPPGIALEF